MTIQVPVLDNECGEDLIRLKHVSLHIGKRVLFEDINITQRRERIAVVGDNGTGKTSLLNIVSGLSRPTSGDVYVERNKIAYVQQGAENWNKKESLYSTLTISSSNGSEEEVTKALLGHKFPLALARRPMTSLSPGERFRAALVSIFMDLGSVQCLILDEPTAGLDLFGRMALIDVLNAWSGGLMITSHDADFISEVGVNQIISLN